jgi:hypothetical protein
MRPRGRGLQQSAAGLDPHQAVEDSGLVEKCYQLVNMNSLTQWAGLAGFIRRAMGPRIKYNQQVVITRTVR